MTNKVNVEEQPSTTTENYEKTSKDKLMTFLKALIKPIGLAACLYFFICSLDTMSSSFRLIAGRYTSEIFLKSNILTNPLAGLMIGVLVTVLVQSSSTSTSIVVSMVASQILEVKYAIPIVMGANIGTSITSALVSLGQVGNRDNFRRAFAGATVHDMFNCLTVSVMLPIEIVTGYLNYVTKAIVEALIKYDINAKEPELLHAITKPFTNLIIQLDKEVLKNISIGSAVDVVELRKRNCGPKIDDLFNTTQNNQVQKCMHEKIKVKFSHASVMVFLLFVNLKGVYIFESINMPEWGIGIILLIGSLVVLITCLLFMVKILNSVFQGPVAKILQKIVNSDLPGPFRYLTGFIAITLGCVLTVVIQSSSVFISTLTPLVGMGLVSLERVFPLTLGSNVGTTVTGILAAFSASASTLKYSLQIALCHSLFNVSGILFWYPLPFLRRVPLRLARFLGDTTARYRWFVIVYLLSVFLLIPLSIFALSMAGPRVLLAVICPLISFFILIGIINVIQSKKPSILPEFLRNWDFLPEPLRSLEPYDKLITTYCMCCKCCVRSNQIEENPQTEEVRKESMELDIVVAHRVSIETLEKGNINSKFRNSHTNYAFTTSL